MCGFRSAILVAILGDPPRRMILVRALSSVGRAPRLHRGCRGFESLSAHHFSQLRLASGIVGSMGAALNLIRVVRSRAQLAALLGLALIIGWTASTRLMVCTPLGIHCPTASVQSVTVPVKSCCGQGVGYASRKPMPGEHGFVQCRCAEKRAGQQQANTGSGTPHFELFVSEPFTIVVPERTPEAVVRSAATAATVAVAIEPLVPPPSLV